MLRRLCNRSGGMGMSARGGQRIPCSLKPFESRKEALLFGWFWGVHLAYRGGARTG